MIAQRSLLRWCFCLARSDNESEGGDSGRLNQQSDEIQLWSIISHCTSAFLKFRKSCFASSLTETSSRTIVTKKKRSTLSHPKQVSVIANHLPRKAGKKRAQYFEGNKEKCVARSESSSIMLTKPSSSFWWVFFLTRLMVKFRETMLFVNVGVCLEHGCNLLQFIWIWSLWKPVNGIWGSVFGLEVLFVLDFDTWSTG